MVQVKSGIYYQLIISYNAEFAKAYDQALAETAGGTPESIDEEMVGNIVSNTMQGWYQKPIPGLEPAMTADGIIDKISSLDEAIELTACAAVYCDDVIPDRIRIKLGSFGTAAVAALEKLILDEVWESRSETSEAAEFSVAIIASFIRLLADWQCFENDHRLLAHFVATNQPDERIADAMRYYLVASGRQVTPALIQNLRKHLEQDGEAAPAFEYLLIALTDIGKESPEEAIFSCLRDCFKKMKNKVIAAICLGDYGDGRGVQVLKGWLDRHPEEHDRQLISEMLSSIRRLGGDITDVQNRLPRAY